MSGDIVTIYHIYIIAAADGQYILRLDTHTRININKTRINNTVTKHMYKLIGG